MSKFNVRLQEFDDVTYIQRWYGGDLDVLWQVVHVDKIVAVVFGGGGRGPTGSMPIVWKTSSEGAMGLSKPGSLPGILMYRNKLRSCLHMSEFGRASSAARNALVSF